jgi:hypothetical protein
MLSVMCWYSFPIDILQLDQFQVVERDGNRGSCFYASTVQFLPGVKCGPHPLHVHPPNGSFKSPANPDAVGCPENGVTTLPQFWASSNCLATSRPAQRGGEGEGEGGKNDPIFICKSDSRFWHIMAIF